MAQRENRTRIACLVFLCTLSVGLLFASSSSPPSVEVRDCLMLEEGTPISVTGVVTDIHSYESGTETIILVDRAGGASVKIVALPTGAEPIAERVSIGDLITVEGEVARDASNTIVFATREGTTLVCRSEYVLSVQFLCENWRGFESDRFNISGELDEESGVWTLRSSAGERRIALECPKPIPEALKGCTVVVDCVLLVNQEAMYIFLSAIEISPSDR